MIRGYVNTVTGEHHGADTGRYRRRTAGAVPCSFEYLTGDALGSRRCDCGQQYDAAMRMIAKAGRGAPYLYAAGRGAASA